ncbi:hypothetical protein MLD38_022427 [Melastoma candidum]|uniref:Uncharacterized protein n=1 Tax=Melastoma candidum TaxID=119954 RepID=A0ACB9QJ48_9MYRT|nr:hypothetical protein MLD38_022427 [Melastoma candidum]
MAYPHYRSQFGDTTFTKVFVGGLAWETPTEEMRKYFEQFGEILEAVIINDKVTGKSKGYGFVTFRDPESARKACADPNPKIDGRRANCNIAALGRSRPSPPRGRTQGGSGSPYQGGTRSATTSPGSSSYASGGGISTQLNPPPLPPPLPPPHPVFYSPYGFQPYSTDYAYHPQAPYGPLQDSPAPYYQHQFYSSTPASPSSSAGPTVVSPYYYGYSPSPRGSYRPAHRPSSPPYLYYPPPGVPPFQPPTLQPLRHLFPPSATDPRQATPPTSSEQQQAAVPTSASSSEGPAS